MKEDQERRRKVTEMKGGDKKKEDQELVLTRVDREGNVWPVDRPADEPAGGKRAKKRAKKTNERETHGEDGKRTRYFADDDKYSLKDLLQQEKMTSAKDQLNMFNSRAASKLNSAAIRGEAEGNDGDFAVDDVFVAKSGGKLANVGGAGGNTFSLDKSIFQSKKIKAATENCQFCLDNEEKFLKHLMVSVSDKACLLLPANTSLVEGHCYIVPLNHVSAVTGVDEDVYEEMQKYRQCLVRMFDESEDLDCVFMESALRLDSHPHAVLECVPLERELGDVAPIYFKKAMMESDVEWAINKRIVELAKVPGNSIRRAVPKGMPYFHVDFGSNAGFAHVVEDENLFKRNFGLEILGGMMDSDPFLWRKPPKEDFEAQMKKCVDFSNKWRPFDWTEEK